MDLIGNIFGCFTVIDKGKKVNTKKDRSQYWICKCVCGAVTELNTSYLNYSRPKNCLKCRSLRPMDQNKLVNSIHYRYAYRSKIIKKEFSLTPKQVEILIFQKCNYCKDEPNRLVKCNKRVFNWSVNGIDRLDNSKGYTLENSVTCCSICNKMKLTLTEQEFKSHILKIAKNMNLLETF